MVSLTPASHTTRERRGHDVWGNGVVADILTYVVPENRCFLTYLLTTWDIVHRFTLYSL